MKQAFIFTPLATMLLSPLFLGCSAQYLIPTCSDRPNTTKTTNSEGRENSENNYSKTAQPLVEPRGVIFVAHGSGGFNGTALALRSALCEHLHGPLPYRVEEVRWGHGTGRILSDQIDWRHIQIQGEQLAHRVREELIRRPGHPVVLCGYSAGCGVVLQAAERLPRDSVERIILLSPSVSANYDMRAALLASRQGADVFYSRLDWWVLGVCVGIVGSADRQWGPVAGRVGFLPEKGNCPTFCPEDAVLLKLRQYPWNPGYFAVGNWGGHFGTTERGFLRSFVVPLLVEDSR